MKHMHVAGGQSVQFMSVKPGGTGINRWNLEHGYNYVNRNGRVTAQAVGRRLITADDRLTF